MAKSKTSNQTILFSDIAGSTRLYDLLGDSPARRIVAVCIELMNNTVEAHHGQVIKTIGDAVMCRFDTPEQAALAAIRMQEATASNTEVASNQIQFRIGLHHGPVLEESGDLFGDAVNLAARVAKQAKAGQIITTHASLKKMSPKLTAAARRIDQTRLKGKQAPIVIYELAWGEPEELTMVDIPTGLNESDPLDETFLILDLHEQHARVNHEQPVVTMGRDAGNQIVVNDPKVSRLHARIEMRRTTFVLVDQSTNGTFILPEEGEMIHLKWDEMPLVGEGVINLGRASAPDSPHPIRYCAI